MRDMSEQLRLAVQELTRQQNQIGGLKEKLRKTRKRLQKKAGYLIEADGVAKSLDRTIGGLRAELQAARSQFADLRQRSELTADALIRSNAQIHALAEENAKLKQRLDTVARHVVATEYPELKECTITPPAETLGEKMKRLAAIAPRG